MQSVLEGSSYVRSKEGLSLINEAILSLMLEEYMEYRQMSTNEKQNALGIIKSLQIDEDMESAVSQAWSSKKSSLGQFVKGFNDFKSNFAFQSDNFKYWKFYTDELYPICANLTLSLRSGDWKLY